MTKTLTYGFLLHGVLNLFAYLRSDYYAQYAYQRVSVDFGGVIWSRLSRRDLCSHLLLPFQLRRFSRLAVFEKDNGIGNPVGEYF